MIDLLDKYSEEELELINVNHLPGLKKKTWVRVRGARDVQVFHDDVGDTVIHEFYNYTMKNGDREIQTYERKMEWIGVDFQPFMQLDTTPDIDEEHIAEINKVCRNWRMDYLERAAKGLATLANTLAEPYKTHYLDVSNSIETLLEHYDPQILKYRNRNFLSMELEAAILAETDPAILTLLDKRVRPADATFPNGLTARESIMYQLTGVIP